MEGLLSSRGFQTVLLLGKRATSMNIWRALECAPHCARLVVSLHGHGCNGRISSFVPYDACGDVRVTQDKIGMDRLQSWRLRWRGHSMCLIADCCYGGNFVLPIYRLRCGTDAAKIRRQQQEKARIVLSSGMMYEKTEDGDVTAARKTYTRCS